MSVVLLTLAACVDSGTPQVDLVDDYNFTERCISQADVDFCLEEAKKVAPDSDRARHAFGVACNHDAPGACEHFVRTFHAREPGTAIQYAARTCLNAGQLCEDLLDFEERYPDQQRLLKIVMPPVREKLAAEKGKDPSLASE